MDDKIYHGPGHPVGAHFHSGPKGERGLPGVSPKVDMTYNEDDGTVVFTVTDGYGQREQAVPVSERIDEWADEHGHEAVDQWLDDHPEATTTVQDGSITYAKLNSNINSGFVLDNGTYKYDYNGLVNKPEADDTLSVEGAFADAKSVGDAFSKAWSFRGEVIPAPSSGVFHDMLENIYDYMDHADDMFYGSLNGYQYETLTDAEKIEVILTQTGAYNSDPETHRSLVTNYIESDCNPIICSWFVYAITKGIRFKDSIFNGKTTNTKFYDWGFDWRGLEDYYTDVDDVEVDSRPLASRMAHYCYDRGYTYTPNEDWSNVRPGDILFISNSQNEDTWGRVGHLAIFLGVAAGQRIYYAEVSSSSASSSISEQYPVHIDRSAFTDNPAKQVQYIARLPYNDGDRASVSTNIFANEASLRGLSTTVTGTGSSSYFATAVLAEDVEWKVNRWYTVAMSLDMDFSTVASVNVMGAGSSTSVASITKEQPNGLYVLRFFISPSTYDRFEVDDSHATGLRLRIASTSASTSTAVTVNWVACYEGYCRVGTDGFVPYAGIPVEE